MLVQGPLVESNDQHLSSRVIGININGKGITISEGETKDLDDGPPSWAECKFSSLSVYNRRVAYNKYSFMYMPYIFAYAVLHT